MRDHKSEKEVAAYLHPGTVPTSFFESFDAMREFDVAHYRRLIGRIGNQAGALTIVQARNDVCGMALDSPADCLFFIDSDMGFETDTLERLLHAADPVERPIVGALCFGRQLLRKGLYGAKEFKVFPTVYRLWGESFVTIPDYPRDKLCKVDATGAAVHPHPPVGPTEDPG